MLTIREFFTNKKILVTGASGFIGKVLVEKLLRSCTLVSTIYVLLRSKKNKSPQERWDAITKEEVFDRLKCEYPEALNKVIVIESDVKLKGLGLSDSDRRKLEEEVSVVFHSAASVRFDDTITDAINLNTRGSLEMIKLACKMKNLQCFIYVSTTYSNSHLLNSCVIEEQVYPTSIHYENIIKIVESNDPGDLAVITSKILGKYPNTYTFSKSLAENVMIDYSQELPIVILRPSVVVSSMEEPIVGWIDNFNGIMGISAGIAAGILRVLLAKKESALDYAPVDYVVNSLIAAAWKKSTDTESSESKLAIYNCAYGNIMTANFQDLAHYAVKVSLEDPYNQMVWYPHGIIIENSTVYNFLFYILQLFPACLLDLGLLLYGSKPMFIKLYRKIFNVTHAYKSFSLQLLSVFSNKNLLLLHGALEENDKILFNMVPPAELPTTEKVVRLQHNAMRKFMLKERCPDKAKNLSKLRKFYWLEKVLFSTVLTALLWILYALTMRLF